MKIILCFIFIALILFSCRKSTSSAFTMNLIHRDSPLSPYYSSSHSYYDTIHNSLSHSITRSSHISAPKVASPSPHKIQSPLTATPVEYLMKISIGTPPLDFLAIADTGSDLTWTQCMPCSSCYKQYAPLFDPRKSSTMKEQPCNSRACRSLWPTACRDNTTCSYTAIYRDRSISIGDLSWESFTFESTSGKPVVFPNITFGCGYLNRGLFDEMTGGIVGLGNSDLSIINQISNTVNRRFSYCMVPFKYNMSSKISLGNDAVVSGPGVQTTPYFTKDADTYYYPNLESVSIGDTNIKFESEACRSKKGHEPADRGNIAIDWGTTLTFLPSEFYEMIEAEFKRFISSTPVEGEYGLRLCYKNEKDFEDKVPTVTFHFSGAASWELGVLNTMLRLEDGKICLSMAPSSVAICGNLQQMDFLVGYDLDAKTLSFDNTDCAKH